MSACIKTKVKQKFAYHDKDVVVLAPSLPKDRIIRLLPMFMGGISIWGM